VEFDQRKQVAKISSILKKFPVLVVGALLETLRNLISNWLELRMMSEYRVPSWRFNFNAFPIPEIFSNASVECYESL